MTKKNASAAKRPRWQSLVGTGILLLVIVFVYLRTGTVPDELLEEVLGTDAATVSAILQQTATATATQAVAQTAIHSPTATDEPSATRTVVPSRQPTATPTSTRPPTRAPPSPTSSPTSNPTPTATRVRSQSGLPFVLYGDLPPEARDTIRLIDQNGPFPFRQDDSTFQNREGILPSKPRGWYREFTVITPGSQDRGARRIVEGEDGLLFYTDDHYDSFREVIR
ncbi:MAG: ribonuclease domain-containing protein [Caldilineaceae bacterium]